MATRRLTIASMAAPGWVYLEEVANSNERFQAACHGRIKVARSNTGRTYRWETNSNHIRIFVNMEGVDPLPLVHYSSSGVGWFVLDGFERADLGTSGVIRAVSHAPRIDTSESDERVRDDTSEPNEKARHDSFDDVDALEEVAAKSAEA